MTFYLTDNAGEACGPGTRQGLDPQMQTLMGHVDLALTTGFEGTWNTQYQDTREYMSGVWDVRLWLSVGFAQSASVRAIVERRTSGCDVVQTILDKTANASGSARVEYSFSGSFGSLRFNQGDLLVLRILHASGSNATLRYNDNDEIFADSRIILPAEGRCARGMTGLSGLSGKL